MKKYDDNLLLKSALGFYTHAKNSYEKIDFIQGSNIAESVGPCIVLYSFTAELLIKYKISVSKNKSIHGHELSVLYKKLNKTDQNLIKEHFEECISKKSFDLEQIALTINFDINNEINPNIETIEQFLEYYNSSFSEWRYFFEYSNEKVKVFNFSLMDNFIQSIIFCLKQTLSKDFDFKG